MKYIPNMLGPASASI